VLKGVGGKAGNNYRGARRSGMGPGARQHVFFSFSAVSLRVVQINSVRPGPSHSATESQGMYVCILFVCLFVSAYQYKYRVPIFRRSVLARGPGKKISPRPEPALVGVALTPAGIRTQTVQLVV
jgi:hypothetical protein